MRMDDLRQRTKNYAVRIVRLNCALPKSTEAQVMGKQLIRSGTSVAANFREATRARSDAEFISKLGIVEQEADESLLWLELLVECNVVSSDRLQPLMSETEELLKIVVTCIKSAKARNS